VKPGEHPRLLFRKGDIATLREKARTPEGKAIIARLRTLLGEDEPTPMVYNPHPTRNVGPKGMSSLPVGAFTLSHGAGFGFLHLLTGQKSYTDLARTCLEKTFEGQPDRDERYAWKRPGTGFRLGFVLQGVGLAYDFCYDAWDESFRRRVVREIQEQKTQSLAGNGGREMTLENLARGDRYPPGSNHYGAFIGGAGLAVLAIMGDPGADDGRLGAVLETVEKSLVTLLTKGFGDHGWFAEGTHPGRVASNTGVVPLLQSLKVAAGKDYISPRPNGQWLTLRWVMEIVPRDGKASIPHRGDYGGDVVYARAPMISHSGEFSQGLGAVPPELRPAVVWCYNHFVEPGERTIYDAIMYPHHAVYAFVNWPIGEPERNPGELLPRAVEDKTHGYYMFRNGWQDEDDILVTALLNRGPRGYKGVGHRPVIVWGLGIRTSFGQLSGETTHYRAAADGSATLTAKGKSGQDALAIDFSGASGAPLLLVGVGPSFRAGKEIRGRRGATANATSLTVGGITCHILTLQRGAAPTPRVDGDKVAIGRQTISFDGQTIILGVMGKGGRKAR
jgi:hypothetical protein